MKKLFLVPVILVIISIIASIISFQKSNELTKGYLYVDGGPKETFFEGEYFLLIGNLGTESDTLSLSEENDGVLITVYDQNENILMEHLLTINKVGGMYDPSIVKSVISTDMNDVDELSESLLVVELEESTVYDIEMDDTENHSSSEELDLVLVHISADIYRLKSIMENVSFTTGVFSIVSFLTILAIMYVKKED